MPKRAPREEILGSLGLPRLRHLLRSSSFLGGSSRRPRRSAAALARAHHVAQPPGLSLHHLRHHDNFNFVGPRPRDHTIQVLQRAEDRAPFVELVDESGRGGGAAVESCGNAYDVGVTTYYRYVFQIQINIILVIHK